MLKIIRTIIAVTAILTISPNAAAINMRALMNTSDSLARAAAAAAAAGDITRAENIEKQNADMLRHQLAAEHDFIAAALNRLAKYQAAAGRFDDAWKNANSSALMWKTLYNTDNFYYAVSLSDAAYYNARRGNLSYAKQDAAKAIELVAKMQSENQKGYGRMLTNRAYTFFFPGEYKDAIETANAAITVTGSQYGKQSPEYAAALSLLAAATSRTEKQQDNAIAFATTALGIQNKTLPQYHFDKALTLQRISLAHMRRADSKKAEEYGLQAIAIWDSLHVIPTEYEDCVWNMALLHSTNGEHRHALDICTKLIAHKESTGATNSLQFVNMLACAAECHYRLGNPEDAILMQKRAIAITEKVKSGTYTSLVSAYYNLARYMFESGKPKEAINAQQRSVKICEKLYKGKQQHAESLSRLASIESASGDYESAILSQTKANKILQELENPDKLQVLHGLNNLASYQKRADKFPQAYDTELEIINNYAGNDTLNKNFTIALTNAGIYAKNCNNHSAAISLQRRSLNILKRLILTSENEYIDGLTMLINYCSEADEYAMAADAQQEMANIYANKFGPRSNQYADAMETYASFLFIDKQLDKAIAALTETANIYEKSDAERYKTALGLLSYYHSAAGHNDEAIKLSNKMESVNRDSETPTVKRAIELQQAAQYQQAAGNNAEALRLSARALEMLEQTDARDTQSHAKILSDVSGYYALVHNYPQAIANATKSVNIYSQLADTANLATAINNLSLYYSYSGNSDKVDSLTNRALQLQAKYSGPESIEYARILNNAATNKYNTGNIVQALAMGEQAMHIFRKHGKENTNEYAGLLNNQSVYLFKDNKEKEAYDNIDQALEIRKNTLGVNHPEYIHSLTSLCSMLSSSPYQDKLVARAKENTELLTDMLRRQFMSLPAAERASYWNAWNTWYRHNILNYAHHNPVPQMINAAYEGTIFAKGLMLNSECNLKDLIAESASPEINRIYAQLQDVRGKLNKIYEQPETRRSLIDSLEHAATALERRLVSSSREYGDYTANLSIPASAVRNSLAPDQAAVEFVSFTDGSTTLYYAFILTAADSVPQYVKIASGNDMQAARNNRTEMSRTLWLPVAKHLAPEINTVFFAPDGEIYSIPAEYLPDFENPAADISARWTLHRLSSTRQLARCKTTPKPTSATVIGGLAYNTDGTLSSYDLPQTKIEAENIYALLQPVIGNVNLLTGTQGSESAFRSISGHGCSLLHIATHGFCISEEDADYQACDLFTSAIPGESHAEDNMLRRSGLMLHGAAPTLRGRGPKDRDNDGILTAMEIARLDFRGLDLAVLSACQTALGDVTGEGVFGLQRGFKKAGAQSLLMSLWKVDDKATRLLMNRFYENLANGMSKSQALADAQNYLRNYTPETEIFEDDVDFPELEEEPANPKPYDDPQFYAAFVLLDAID